MPPPVSRAGNAESAAPRFVPRGEGERDGINAGLKEDRQSFIKFISQQPYAWYSSISDKQDLSQGDMRSTKQIKELINRAHLTNSPEGDHLFCRPWTGRDWGLGCIHNDTGGRGALIARNHGGHFEPVD